mmetsp:Transcript_13083/g.36810  ORF Transcript_13083/g.36810 Transcript_13083/m.36810 type:complete len:84 (-) Transcript_13083:627-878(-)
MMITTNFIDAISHENTNNKDLQNPSIYSKNKRMVPVNWIQDFPHSFPCFSHALVRKLVKNDSTGVVQAPSYHDKIYLVFGVSE